MGIEGSFGKKSQDIFDFVEFKHLLAWFLEETCKEQQIAFLSEFPDEAEFQIGDDEEHERHNGQSHMILPQSPGGVLYSQVVQILLSCASETTHVTTGHW